MHKLKRQTTPWINAMFRRIRFPFYQQKDAADCGPACLRMIAEHHGKHYTMDTLRQRAFNKNYGISLLDLTQAAEQIGFRTLPAVIPNDKLDSLIFPCIVHWEKNHYVVIISVTRNKVKIADPARGTIIKMSRKEFFDGWSNSSTDEGIILFLDPTPEFYLFDDEESKNRGIAKFLYTYISKQRKYMFFVFGLMLVGSLFQFASPYLTQAIVDIAIQDKAIYLVSIIVIAQFVLSAGTAIVGLLRSRLILYIGTRTNISIISDFLKKLMRMPLQFFNSRTTGDILQRINDHYQIENLITVKSLDMIIASVQFFAFILVLFFYSVKIAVIFLIGTLIYISWTLIFITRRRLIEYKHFALRSKNQNMLIQLIQGISEIKLSFSEEQKSWEWRQIQEKLFDNKVESLMLDQYQIGGGTLVNEAKNLGITLVAATAVIAGDMTLGRLMAIQFIVGALNGPILYFLEFIRSAQDAKISFERVEEIHSQEEANLESESLPEKPKPGNISIKDLNFRYGGTYSPNILQDISIEIQSGKITALVGPSGSGKTTLLKILSKFYQATSGEIKIGGISFLDIPPRNWWQGCGVVLQDGFIFSDSVGKNIALGKKVIDKNRLHEAARIANIEKDIESLPFGYETKIGMDGLGLSQGQKQRILLARAFYKDPEYLFLDEATNALDAETEHIILENLKDFFSGRTVIIIAHRLSTIKRADNVIVLNKGQIIEQGSQDQLRNKDNQFYKLFKEQMELEK